METCTIHHDHCWCEAIPFIATLGAGIAIAVFAIRRWEAISNLIGPLFKGNEK
jgi:hypothetical protein